MGSGLIYETGADVRNVGNETKPFLTRRTSLEDEDVLVSLHLSSC